MSKPLGIQLYTVRDALAQDFNGTIERLAGMGYAAVETAGFPGTTPQAAAALFNRLGLKAPAAHSGLPDDGDWSEPIDAVLAIGVSYFVCPWLPPEQFTTVDDIKRNCERLNEANAVLRENGIQLLYHNHWFEYEQQSFGLPYHVMLEHLEPTVGFELDAYWVKVGGCNPVEVLRELGSRVALLHVKDGPAVKDEPMVAVGDGVVDYTTIIPAAEHAEYHIVELDRCATDMMEAVEKSFGYLTEKGLGHGR